MDVMLNDNVVSWGLWQPSDEKGKRAVPIGFWSKQLTGAQQRYMPLEKNMLAAYMALQHVEP